MDMYKLKWTILQLDIFSLLCQKAGEKLSQREIAGILKVSPTAVANSIKNLKNTELIKVEKTKTINFISFNRDNPKAIELKRAENLKNVYLSGLADYLERELAGSTVILFGSYSFGEDAAGSDIDIAVIGSAEKEMDVKKFSRLLGRKISLNFYKSIDGIGKNLRENILNGIVISGSVKL